MCSTPSDVITGPDDDPSSDVGVYYAAQPPGHTRVCWSAALGHASRGQAKYRPHPEIIATARST